MTHYYADARGFHCVSLYNVAIRARRYLTVTVSARLMTVNQVCYEHIPH